MSSNDVNKKVIIGITGGVNSAVAAYLLKKQGYECIGITILFDNPSDPRSMASHCQVTDLNACKAFCKTLEIPFYAVQAVDLFNDRVLEKVVISRLSGQRYSPCVDCANLLFELLSEKAELLNAELIATGHYAKIYRDQRNNEATHGPARDMKTDESYLLGSLKQEYINKMVLPLSDMREGEIEKIASSIGFKSKTSKIATEMCFVKDPHLEEFVVQSSSKSLRPTGNVFQRREMTKLGKHDGIHKYYLGQNRIGQKEAPLLEIKNKINRDWVVALIDTREGNIFLDDISSLDFDYCCLQNFSADPMLDISKPLNAYAKFSTKDSPKPCQLFYKNNHRVVLKFENLIRGAFIGEYVTLYTGVDKGAIIIGGGDICEQGMYKKLDRLEGLPDAKEVDGGKDKDFTF